MEKYLPAKLHHESLKQLAKEQLVELIMEQAIAIEKLRTKVLELEQEINKLKVSRDLDSTTSSKPPSGDILKKTDGHASLNSKLNHLFIYGLIKPEGKLVNFCAL